MSKQLKTPNPGSTEAQLIGCLCPVIDNHYGDGVPDGKGGSLLSSRTSCPLHGHLQGKKLKIGATNGPN